MPGRHLLGMGTPAGAGSPDRFSTVEGGRRATRGMAQPPHG